MPAGGRDGPVSRGAGLVADAAEKPPVRLAITFVSLSWPRPPALPALGTLTERRRRRGAKKDAEAPNAEPKAEAPKPDPKAPAEAAGEGEPGAETSAPVDASEAPPAGATGDDGPAPASDAPGPALPATGSDG